MRGTRWRVVAAVLMAAVLVGLVPAVAQAKTTKVKTKVVFYGRDAGAYREYWSLDTPSLPPVYAKARLMYYKRSAKKWVGYAGRTVRVTRGDDFLDEDTLTWKKKTDSKGYFKVKMSRPSTYNVKYAGSKYSLPCGKSEYRFDEVSVRRSSTITTSSVDATHTRYTFVTDYQYNPYVAQMQGHVGIRMGFAVTDDEYKDVRWIYTGETELIERPFTGFGRSEVSVVVPSDTFEEAIPFLAVDVTYPGEWLFDTEDYEDDNPWFY